MVHIIFPVTWAALLHYYLPVLPAVEWDFAPPPAPRPHPTSPKGQLPIRRREQLLLNQLIKWLAVPSVLSFLITLQSCARVHLEIQLRRKRTSAQPQTHRPVFSLTVGAIIAITFNCPCLCRSNSIISLFIYFLELNWCWCLLTESLISHASSTGR